MIPYKLIAIGVGGLLVLGALFYVCHAIYMAGDMSGYHRGHQELVDFQQAETDKATTQATANALREAEATRLRQEKDDEAKAQLAALAADRDQFAGRLRNALGVLRASANAAAQVNSQSASAEARHQDVAQQPGQLVTLVADARTECIANDDALDQLVDEVTPQL